MFFICTTGYSQKPLKSDSTVKSQDTSYVSKKNRKDKAEPIKSKVKYNAKDSILFEVQKKKVYLYGKAEIDYEKIVLKADYIEINFDSNTVYSTYRIDSLGKRSGIPQFTEGTQTFNASVITYNFKSKKGIIKEVIMEESKGYLHGSKVKRSPNSAVYIKNGAYTTCSNEHAHFQIDFSKAKIIPGDKIITGPAYLEIEDIPVPLGLPFGYFPSKNKQKSGLIFPTFGEDATRGFFLNKVGYYFGLNDYVDLTLTSDLYTRGSYNFNASSNYALRYKYKGNVSISLANTILGEEKQPGYQESKDFKIIWNHNQDPKANLNSRFAASVNFGSSKYNAYNVTNAIDHLTNTYTSSISYHKEIGENNNMHLDIDLRQDQNTQTKVFSMTFPEVAFSVDKFYPLRTSERVGKRPWYENIGVNYSVNFKNQVDTLSNLTNLGKHIRNGMQHSIPVSYSMPVFKYFTFSSQLALTERWYTQSLKQEWISNTDKSFLSKYNVNGFQTAHEASFTSSISTKLFGIIQFKKSKIKAIRHVITPSIGFSYYPGFTDYYHTVQTDTKGTMLKYSIFQNGIYGTPLGDKSGKVNLSVANNLEMKVRSKKDSVGFKKIVLIDNLTFNLNYDLFKDSMKLSDLTMTGRTKLLNNLDVNYGAAWSPYALDKNRQLINRSYWDQSQKLLRFESTNWAFNLNYNIKPKAKSKPQSSALNNPVTDNEPTGIPGIDKFAPFNIPYNFNVFLTLNYTKNWVVVPHTETIVKTLGFNGNFDLTPKWKISFTSGYDFNAKDFSYTTVSIGRDLHCWEMKFDWIPFGIQKRYEFLIRVKPGVLQDLKLTKKKELWQTQQNNL
ncbi:MAG: putative LPS assembly protein LptD [Bacteroidota bacterium]|nr:putative LPS assembly protein LptD [Bacteroidota bacterium]